MDTAYLREFSQPPKIAEHKVQYLHSMVVSGSPKRWDRWHSPSPNCQYIPLIYHLYIAFWGVICYLPPFRGTRNNHWYILGTWNVWWTQLQTTKLQPGICRLQETRRANAAPWFGENIIQKENSTPQKTAPHLLKLTWPNRLNGLNFLGLHI